MRQVISLSILFISVFLSSCSSKPTILLAEYMPGKLWVPITEVKDIHKLKLSVIRIESDTSIYFQKRRKELLNHLLQEIPIQFSKKWREYRVHRVLRYEYLKKHPFYMVYLYSLIPGKNVISHHIYIFNPRTKKGTFIKDVGQGIWHSFSIQIIGIRKKKNKISISKYQPNWNAGYVYFINGTEKHNLDESDSLIFIIKLTDAGQTGSPMLLTPPYVKYELHTKNNLLSEFFIGIQVFPNKPPKLVLKTDIISLNKYSNPIVNKRWVYNDLKFDIEDKNLSLTISKYSYITRFSDHGNIPWEQWLKRVRKFENYRKKYFLHYE